MKTDDNSNLGGSPGDVPGNCGAMAESLAAWVDGALRGEDARAVTRHVAECPTCAEEAEALRGLLADLHSAYAATSVPAEDDALWTTLAARIDAAVTETAAAEFRVAAPQATPAEAEHAGDVLALPQRRWRTAAWALSSLAAAAVLAIVAARFVVPSAQTPPVAQPHWTDALQARMSIEDDPAAGDSDPVDDLDDLDDDEVEALAAQLGEEG